ncbi:DNA-processing protein DprA [Candidatus Poriferisodalis sp.]|uniref:DNA-processing protein DprA n=1 Tax=Candidatus Poriferisodalis sp. TaxID=3101277 RepID=UPI003B01F2BF
MSSALADAGHRAELGALLELVSLPAAGPARLRVLLAGRSAQTAVEDLRAGRPATLAALGACRGVDTALIASWRQRLGAALRRAEAGGWQVGADRLDAHERAGVWLQLPWQAGAAGLWESDPEPPAVLFGQGTPIDAALRRVGIVGTRRCSAYGRTVARMLGSGLAAEGIAVVSGLATGIDGIAQRAALDRDGPVIGVVGSGLDRVYPAANRTLWAEVAERGTLLSEYPLGTQAVQWHFPARNRILAALCEVLVVVESGPSGGSMYTVDAAAERGRQVMAVPGPITSASSTGTNRLLAEGCAPVCGVDDVLVALGEARGDVGVPAARELPDDPLSRRILDELTGEPRSVDQLVMGTGASLGELASTLGRMQLSGWVVETGGWWEKAR